MSRDKQLHRVKPTLDELLPTSELQEAYEEASAALEAGKLVRALRKTAGLTQQALAERLSVTQARVSAIEAGEGRDGPSYGLLKRIAAACGTSAASVLAEAFSKRAAMDDDTSSRVAASPVAASQDWRVHIAINDAKLWQTLPEHLHAAMGDAKSSRPAASLDERLRAAMSDAKLWRSTGSPMGHLRAVIDDETLVSSVVAHAFLVRAAMSDTKLWRSTGSPMGHLRAVMSDETLVSSVVAHALLVRAAMSDAKSSRSAASLDERLRAAMAWVSPEVAKHKS